MALHMPTSTWALPQITSPCSSGFAPHHQSSLCHTHSLHRLHTFPPSRLHHHHQHQHHHCQYHLRSFGVCSASPLSAPYSPSDPLEQKPGFTVIEEFYAAINRRDLDSVSDLIAEDCIYEDLIFPQPFIGKKAIIEFFGKFTGTIGSDLQFAIDEISKNDPLCIGVTWHLEWRGKPFPFSKGCSFYRLTTFDGKPQIVYGRDSVEPAIKPGDAALVAIEAVVAVLQRFPGLGDRF